MIYIATHKEFRDPNLEGYIPIQVGAVLKENLGYLRDDVGDNISFKNPNFCELTGLYWIWKNTDDEFKGLVHYRRYFGKNNISRDFSKVYSYDKMVKFAKSHDIVLPYVEYFKQNAKDEILVRCCTSNVFNELRTVLEKKYPDYIDDFDSFWNQNKAVLFNMMFCKKKIFDDYCSWLFDILFELEKNVSLDSLNEYQKRIYGFLSERLLNIWVNHNKLTRKNVGVINTENQILDNTLLCARRAFHRISR